MLKSYSIVRAAIAAVLACSMFFGTQANAATLDFETLSFTGTPSAPPTSISATPTTYTEDGFTLTTTGVNPGFGFYRYGTSSGRFPGSTSLINNTVNRTTVLTKNDGGSFFVSSIDLSPTQTIAENNSAFDLLFTGTKSNSDTVTQTFSVGPGIGLSTFIFLPTFTDLVSLNWEQDSPSHQFDNIVLDENVAAVPLPAALPLLLSALGFFGFLGWRRKRSAAA